jgi:hypothetical protein
MDLSQIEAGKCYLANVTGEKRRVLRVLQIMSDGHILYDQRGSSGSKARFWRPGGMIDTRAFVRMAEREVPYDWVMGQEESLRSS